MPERSNLDMLPADLVPLGIVHNDERRGDLMAVVNSAHRKGAVATWAYKGHHSANLQRVPQNYELNWVGGPGREEGDNPDHPGLAYYCDVTAEPRLRRDKPGAYVLHAGAAEAEIFTQIQISRAVLEKLRASVGDQASPESSSDLSLKDVVERANAKKRRGLYEDDLGNFIARKGGFPWLKNRDDVTVAGLYLQDIEERRDLLERATSDAGLLPSGFIRPPADTDLPRGKNRKTRIGNIVAKRRAGLIRMHKTASAPKNNVD